MKSFLMFSVMFALIVGSSSQVLAQAQPDTTISILSASERFLVDQTQSSDQDVKVTALKSLKDESISGEVVKRVSQIIPNRNESDEVRNAALEVASVTTDSKLRKIMLRVAEDKNDSLGVRLFAYRALYMAAFSSRTYRKALLDMATDRNANAVLRMSAIWGLLMSSGDTDVRKKLLRIAEDQQELVQLRTESLLTLTLANRATAVRKRIVRLATSANDTDVRAAAIRSLQVVNSDSAVRKLLEKIVKSEQDLAIVALKALRPPFSWSDVEELHLAEYQGVFRDPLEN